MYIRMYVYVWPNSATRYSVLANMATGRTVHIISALRNRLPRSTPRASKRPWREGDDSHPSGKVKRRRKVQRHEGECGVDVQLHVFLIKSLFDAVRCRSHTARAGARRVGAASGIIIWRPSKRYSFNVFCLGHGWRTFLTARTETAGIFGEILSCVEDLSLLAPYFPSIRWRLSAPYRMASGEAVRLVRHLVLRDGWTNG
jgi:hypothetical protein